MAAVAQGNGTARVMATTQLHKNNIASQHSVSVSSVRSWRETTRWASVATWLGASNCSNGSEFSKKTVQMVHIWTLQLQVITEYHRQTEMIFDGPPTAL